MTTFETLIAATDWAALEGGRAAGDYGPMPEAPRYLRDLLHDDPWRRMEAVEFLSAAGLGHGSTDPVTPRLVPVVVAALLDARSAGLTVPDPMDLELPLRAELLQRLALAAMCAARAGTDDDLRAQARALALAGDALPPADLRNGYQAPDRLAIRSQAAAVLDAVVPFLDDADVRVVHAAVFAIAWLAGLSGAGDRAPAAVRRLHDLAERAEVATGVRGGAAYALAHMGADVTALLDQPELVVRACAALSPSTHGDARAVAALEEALRHTPGNDSWLHPGSGLQVVRLHMDLTRAAQAHAPSFDRLVPGAFAVAVPSGESTPTGWGPLLLVVFPDGWRERPLAADQRRFLRCLVDNPSVWAERAREAMGWFARAGLPYDRGECRTLAGAGR